MAAEGVEHGRIIRLSVAAAAAVTSAFACSRLFGTGGTLIGTAVGAVVSGAAAELYGRAAAAAKARLPRPELNGRLVAEVAAGCAVVAVAAFGVVYGVEKAAGRPLSAVTTGSDVRGDSFTGSTPYTPPAPLPSVLPTVDPSSVPLVSPSSTVVTSSAAPGPSPSATGTTEPTEPTEPPSEPVQSPEVQVPQLAGTPIITSSP